MAEDKDTGQDEDVEGHRFTSATPEEGKEAPGRQTAKTGDEDDVEGHRFTSATPEEGKKDSPGVYTS